MGSQATENTGRKEGGTVQLCVDVGGEGEGGDGMSGGHRHRHTQIQK